MRDVACGVKSGAGCVGGGTEDFRLTSQPWILQPASQPVNRVVEIRGKAPPVGGPPSAKPQGATTPCTASTPSPKVGSSGHTPVTCHRRRARGGACSSSPLSPPCASVTV